MAVDTYYKRVETYLRHVKLWSIIVKKFPPKAVRSAVKRVLDSYLMQNLDPETLDWEATFELLKDYDTVDSFVGYLKTSGKIPASREEETWGYALSEAEKMAATLESRIISEKKYEKLLGFEQENRKLKEQIKRLRREKELSEKEKMKKEEEHAKELEAKALSAFDKRRLEHAFTNILTAELATVPREAMQEFKEELEALEKFSYQEALKIIEALARRIAIEKITISKERPIPIIAPEAPKGLESPLSTLPFPRKPSSEEQTALWDVFQEILTEQGMSTWELPKLFKERIWDVHFKDWNDLINHFNLLIESTTERKPLPPMWQWIGVSPPMPGWRKGAERTEDAIVHFSTVAILNARRRQEEARIEDILEKLEELEMSVSRKEIVEAIKKAWERKDEWFINISKEELETFLGSRIT